MQKLKENIGLILKDSLQVKDNRIGEGDFKEEDGHISPIIMEKKSQLKLQEERIKQAFLENEAAEKETEIKLQTTWENKSTNNNKSCEQQHSQENPVILIESKVESLSQKIVDSLMSTLSLENSPEGSPRCKETKCKKSTEMDESNEDVSHEILAKKDMEIKELKEKVKFQKQQDKYRIEELQNAVQQERSQTLNMMEKVNEEKQSKSDLQEDVYVLRDEISDLQTQLIRHKDEIEELTSLYEAEKLQNLVMEEALAAEKVNFDKLTKSLDDERKRSDEASTRDGETIMELRTALEIEKEKEARLGMESPYPGGNKSHKGSKQSLMGSRQSLSHGQNPSYEKLQEELIQVIQNGYHVNIYKLAP